MRRHATVRTTLLLLVAAGVWANGSGEAPTTQEVVGDFTRIEVAETRIDFRIGDSELEVVVSAPTTGWVAVGFEPSRMMKDANIIIGYVDGDQVVIEDHFGNAPTSHRPDSELGGSADLRIIAGSQADGRTELHFAIPLSSGDEYDVSLSPGNTYTIIYAYAKNGADNVGDYHAERGSFEISL